MTSQASINQLIACTKALCEKFETQSTPIVVGPDTCVLINGQWTSAIPTNEGWYQITPSGLEFVIVEEVDLAGCNCPCDCEFSLTQRCGFYGANFLSDSYRPWVDPAGNGYAGLAGEFGCPAGPSVGMYWRIHQLRASGTDYVTAAMPVVIGAYVPAYAGGTDTQVNVLDDINAIISGGEAVFTYDPSTGGANGEGHIDLAADPGTGETFMVIETGFDDQGGGVCWASQFFALRLDTTGLYDSINWPNATANPMDAANDAFWTSGTFAGAPAQPTPQGCETL